MSTLQRAKSQESRKTSRFFNHVSYLIPHASGSRGFTLMEMLVVTGIIALVSALVFANNNRFGGQVILQNLAYDIALSIRQAQVFGISVQRFQGGYAQAYGMHFDSANPNDYVLFADVLIPPNGTYECPQPGTPTCEIVQSVTIRSGYRISSLCARQEGQIELTCGLSSLDITFRRPEPDAYIRAGGLEGLSEAARIDVSSPQGLTKSILVEVSGQIAVQ